MHACSSLSEAERGAAVALFEQGWGDTAVATHLGVSRWSVRSLYRRWCLHGMGALVGKPTKSSYSFEFKLGVVRRVVEDGETAQQVAQDQGLSSRELVRAWVRAYQRYGEHGLRPKAKGRSPGGGSPPAAGPSTDIERLEQENLRLRAENAYLKKLRALRVQGRQ